MRKIINRLPFTVLFSILFLNSTSQSLISENNLDSLLCKKWSLIKKVRNNIDIPININTDNNILIFHKNHTCESISKNQIEKASWVYNKSMKTITLTYDSNSILKFKLLSLDLYRLSIELIMKNDTYQLTLKSE